MVAKSEFFIYFPILLYIALRRNISEMKLSLTLNLSYTNPFFMITKSCLCFKARLRHDSLVRNVWVFWENNKKIDGWKWRARHIQYPLRWVDAYCLEYFYENIRWTTTTHERRIELEESSFCINGFSHPSVFLNPYKMLAAQSEGFIDRLFLC